MICPKCGIETPVSHTILEQCADAQIAYYAGQQRDALTWNPGSLSTFTLQRIIADALADLWRDCWRQGDNSAAFQRELFRETLMTLIHVAIGEPMEVIKVPNRG